MDGVPLPLPILLDGATGTQLQLRGMPQGVCTETWVLEHPEVLIALQKDYLAAGSTVLTAPTFGANRVRLAQSGIPTEQVADINQKLLALTRKAAEGSNALVAADLSPTGLFLLPHGDTAFEEMVDIYKEQVAALTDADLFLVETTMSMPEARAAVLAIREITQKPIWVSFTCDENGRTLSGTDVLAALIVMEGMGVQAFGLNCSTGPDAMLPIFQRLWEHSHIPLIAKPNAGLPHMEDGIACYHCSPAQFASHVPALAAAGVRIFGGCCGTTPDHITALNQALQTFDFSQFTPLSHDPDVIPCASEREARFITPDVDTGPAIDCTPDLMEDILEAEEEQPTGALKISVLEEDDLPLFAEHQYAVQDALCLYSDVPQLLESALRLYQGRAFYDGTGDLEPEFLQEMKKKYGLIIL